MKLLYYELRKLANSRFIIGCIVIFIILNAVLCSAFLKSPYKTPIDSARKIYSQYLQDPEYVDQLYHSWETEYRNYEERYRNYMKRGGIEPAPPDNHWLASDLSDAQLYEKLYLDVNRSAEYKKSISTIIKAAMASQVSLKDSVNSYEYLYADQIIERYSKLFDTVRLGFEYTRGYDVYLENRVPLLLSLILSSLISPYFYTVERSNNTLSMLRCTKKGKLRLATAKAFSPYVIVLLFFGIAQVTAAVIIYNRSGFSSLDNSIQVFEQYTYCPFYLTALEAIICDFLFKAVCLFLFTSVYILVAARTNYLTACTVGSCVCAAGVLSYYFLQTMEGSVAHSISPLTLAFDSLERYRAINLFGKPFSSVSVIIPLLITIAIVNTLLSVRIYTHSAFRMKILNHVKLRKSLFPHETRAYVPSLTLMKHEIFKFSHNFKAVSSVIIFILVSVILNFHETGIQSTDEAKLQDYIESHLYGEVTAEKSNYVHEEEIRIAQAFKNYDSVVDSYYQGKLPLEEFKPFADERAYAESRIIAIDKLSAYERYLSSQSSSGELWFVYETGWTKLFSDYNLLHMILMVCFISSMLVGVEYASNTSSGGFHQLLRSTPKGRDVTYHNKLSILSGAVFAVYTFDYALRFFIILKRFTLNGFSAPLRSLTIFRDDPFGKCSVGQYLLFHYVYGLILCILLGCTVMAMSYVCEKESSAFIAVSTSSVLPAMMGYLGISLPDCISVPKLLNLKNINSIAMAAGLSVFAAFSVCITWYSRCKYTGHFSAGRKTNRLFTS